MIVISLIYYFADDIFLFLEDNEDSIMNLKYVIFLFEKTSRPNINLAKSSISPMNVEANKVDTIANIRGYKSNSSLLNTSVFH